VAHPAAGAALLNELPADDRTTFLNELPLDLAISCSASQPEERKIAQDLLAYPEHSVGRMMTLDYVAVRAEWTVRESMDFIRAHATTGRRSTMIYVTDAAGHMLDDIRVRRFCWRTGPKVSALMTATTSRWPRPTTGKRRSGFSAAMTGWRCP